MSLKSAVVGESLNQLVPELASALNAAILQANDPFASQLVVVNSPGIAYWLTQKLSDEFGICAGIEFVTWAQLLDKIGVTSDDDPWAPTNLTWYVLRAIDEITGANLPDGVAASPDGVATSPDGVAANLGDSSARRILRQYLGYETDPNDKDALPIEILRGRRGALAQNLARIFSSYATVRPTILQDWAAEAGNGKFTDGLGRPLPADLAWQPEVLLTTQKLINADGSGLAIPPDQRELASFSDDLPQTIFWFGVNRDSFTARDSFVFDSLAQAHRIVQYTVKEFGEPKPVGALVEIHECHGFSRQVDALQDVICRELANDPELQLSDILVICPDITNFAPLLTGAFNVDNSWWDLINALPAGANPKLLHPAQKLRMHIAGRKPNNYNTIFTLLQALFDITYSRALASEVFAIANLDPVRARFGFDTESIDRILYWLREAGARWGWDEEHRTLFGMQNLFANTMQFGIDRLLLGAVMAEDSPDLDIQIGLPFDEMPSSDLAILGRFAEFVARLAGLTKAFRGRHTGAEWLELLTEAIKQLAQPDPQSLVDDAVAEITAELQGGKNIELSARDIAPLLAEALHPTTGKALRRTGAITVVPFEALPGVSYKVVCLLGMDDGLFPRLPDDNGDNLLARDLAPGEPDARQIQRAEFWEAASSASNLLAVFFSARNEVTDKDQPPSVLVSDLIRLQEGQLNGQNITKVAHTRRRVAAANFDPAQPHRQSFDPVALKAAVAAQPGTEANKILASAPVPAAPASEVIEAPAPNTTKAPVPNTLKEIELKALIDFWKNPIAGYLSQTLGARVSDSSNEFLDDIVVRFGGFNTYQVANALTTKVLAAAPLAELVAPIDDDAFNLTKFIDKQFNEAVKQEIPRGHLPPIRQYFGETGQRSPGSEFTPESVARKVYELAAYVHHDLDSQKAVPAAKRNQHIDLALGRYRLIGDIHGITGDLLETVTPSRLNLDKILENWIKFLALQATSEAENTDSSVRVAIVARAGGSGANGEAMLFQFGFTNSTEDEPTDHKEEITDISATEILNRLIELREQGLVAPLRVGLQSSFAYAKEYRLLKATPADGAHPDSSTQTEGGASANRAALESEELREARIRRDALRAAEVKWGVSDKSEDVSSGYSKSENSADEVVALFNLNAPLLGEKDDPENYHNLVTDIWNPLLDTALSSKLKYNQSTKQYEFHGWDRL